MRLMEGIFFSKTVDFSLFNTVFSSVVHIFLASNEDKKNLVCILYTYIWGFKKVRLFYLH